MIKKLGFFALPIFLVACSQESPVEKLSDASNASPSAASVVDEIAPFFAFDEDGGRLNVDRETGEQTAINLERTSLVVDDENEFAALRGNYLNRLRDDAAYSAAHSRPLNYFCDEALLAINAEYDVVKTSDGKILLDDKSLKSGCEYMGGAPTSNALAKKIVNSNLDGLGQESFSYQTTVSSGRTYKVYGKTEPTDASDPYVAKDRNTFAYTSAYVYGYVSRNSYAWMPTKPRGIYQIRGIFSSVPSTVSKCNGGSSWVNYDVTAKHVKLSTEEYEQYFDWLTLPLMGSRTFKAVTGHVVDVGTNDRIIIGTSYNVADYTAKRYWDRCIVPSIPEEDATTLGYEY